MGRGALSWNADRWKAALDPGSDPPGYSSGPDHLGSVVHRDGTRATLGEVVFASLRLDKTPNSRQVCVLMLHSSTEFERVARVVQSAEL